MHSNELKAFMRKVSLPWGIGMQYSLAVNTLFYGAGGPRFEPIMSAFSLSSLQWLGTGLLLGDDVEK